MKKMTALACLLAMLISLTACAAASTPETTAAPETVVTEAPTTEATEAPAEAAVPVRLGVMTGPTGMGMVKLFDEADKDTASPYTYTVKGAAG